jgi:hypothetical protein
VVAATIIVVAALAAVSESVLPLTFAVVLAVVFQPAIEILVHHRFKPTIAVGLVVVGLLALLTGVVGVFYRLGPEPNAVLDRILLSAPAMAGEEARAGEADPAELSHHISGVSAMRDPPGHWAANTVLNPCGGMLAAGWGACLVPAPAKLSMVRTAWKVWGAGIQAAGTTEKPC